MTTRNHTPEVPQADAAQLCGWMAESAEAAARDLVHVLGAAALLLNRDPGDEARRRLRAVGDRCGELRAGIADMVDRIDDLRQLLTADDGKGGA